MIFILRALSHVRKGQIKKGDGQKNREGLKKERKPLQKNERKERRDNATILFHTCASKYHHDLLDREFLVLSLSYTSGNFHYITWLVYFNDGLPQMP